MNMMDGAPFCFVWIVIHLYVDTTIHVFKGFSKLVCILT
jgi:hypothetical protein